jgi:hypothetical protein
LPEEFVIQIGNARERAGSDRDEGDAEHERAQSRAIGAHHDSA